MRISDWSSDVCSSDLRCARSTGDLGFGANDLAAAQRGFTEHLDLGIAVDLQQRLGIAAVEVIGQRLAKCFDLLRGGRARMQAEHQSCGVVIIQYRSEERSVGKEW